MTQPNIEITEWIKLEDGSLVPFDRDLLLDHKPEPSPNFPEGHPSRR